MRPVDRGPIPQINGKDIEYSCYQNAKRDLTERLGDYCSYCEMQLSAGLAIEHVQPKSKQPGRECQWDNFLLACPNCNSTKRDKEINDSNINDYLWPDKDNTFYSFIYTEDGEVRANPEHSPIIQQKANAMIQLVGLNKNPGNAVKASDLRWKDRLDAWGKATRAKQRLSTVAPACSSVMRAQIEDTANSHFSIWLTVFSDDPDMCRRLIRKFKGTATNCFNPDGKPIPREGGQI